MKILNINDQLATGTTMATIGMFDGMHLGHQTLLADLLREASERDLQSCVVTFRQHPQKVLRPNGDLRMITTVDDRLTLLAEQGVDYCLLLDFTPALAAQEAAEFLKLLHLQYGTQALLTGYNHHFGHSSDKTFSDYVSVGRQMGVEVVKAHEYLGKHAPVSSSIIRRLIASGKVDDAYRCMGRPFRLQGTVVQGFHNGRGIGFPTANIGKIDPSLILPHNGAYAVMVNLENGQRLKGMVNVGRRPTLHNGSNLSVEVNIFDFEDDIYGQLLSLDFIRFLRLEYKLGSIEELRAQLTRDRDNAKRYLDKH